MTKLFEVIANEGYHEVEPRQIVREITRDDIGGAISKKTF